MSKTVLGIDQSTNLTAYSVRTDGELVYYGLIDNSQIKNPIERINKLKYQMMELINTHEPDLVALEDCQQQQNPQVFKLLAKLQGVLENQLYESDINYVIIEPPKWRKKCGIKGRKRAEQKKNALAYVLSKYGLTGDIDDIAEGICITEVAEKYYLK